MIKFSATRVGDDLGSPYGPGVLYEDTGNPTFHLPARSSMLFLCKDYAEAERLAELLNQFAPLVTSPNTNPISLRNATAALGVSGVWCDYADYPPAELKRSPAEDRQFYTQAIGRLLQWRIQGQINHHFYQITMRYLGLMQTARIVAPKLKRCCDASGATTIGLIWGENCGALLSDSEPTSSYPIITQVSPGLVLPPTDKKHTYFGVPLDTDAALAVRNPLMPPIAPDLKEGPSYARAFHYLTVLYDTQVINRHFYEVTKRYLEKMQTVNCAPPLLRKHPGSSGPPIIALRWTQDSYVLLTDSAPESQWPAIVQLSLGTLVPAVDDRYVPLSIFDLLQRSAHVGVPA